MRENVVYVGRGEVKKSPSQWVKDKLAARYTEKGRINVELQKIEKIMGPLTDEQRQEAGEKLHLEGKVKKQVTITIIKDAIIGTAIIGGTSFLVARPDVRAEITSTLGAGTRVAGEFASEKLKKGVQKLRPEGGPKPTFFKGLAASILNGTDQAVTAVTTRTDHVLQKATESAMKSMGKKVFNADVNAHVIQSGISADSSDKLVHKAEKAWKKLSKLEKREATAQLIQTSVDNVDAGMVKQLNEMKSTAIGGLSFLNSQKRQPEVENRVQETLATLAKKAKKNNS